MKLPIAASLIALGISALNTGYATQLALVDQEFGHAVLLNYRGNCFAVLPSHVARNKRFSLEQPLYRLNGSGRMFLRDSKNDLAIAFVEGDIGSRCSDPWQQSGADLSSTLEKNATGVIVRLGPEGYQDRTEARIVEFDAERILVATTDTLAQGDVQQGTSGAALEIGGRLAGIAQQSDDPRRAWFFRIDRIAAMASPYMATGTRQGMAAIPKTRADGSRGFRVEAWQGGSDAQSIPEGLERGLLNQPYIVRWDGRPSGLVVTLHATSPVAVQRVELVSGPTMPDTQTPPRTIQLEADVGSPAKPYWRSLGETDMPPTGVLEFSTGGVFARRLRLTVKSLWIQSRDLRIDALRIR